MSDLISRKTALEALADYIHMIDKTMGKGILTYDDCMEAAKSVLGEDELPAVQPESVLTCEGCRYEAYLQCRSCRRKAVDLYEPE